jgi:aminoglycoside phosphotransferase (APT) family kinase protein
VHPYHHRVAERYPELAPAINGVIELMLASRQCLVHGDYSPKNLMTDGADVVVLDCEVAHWGDPRFDVAFCLSHLLLKIIHSHACPSQLARAAETYLAAYGGSGLRILDEELTRATGCLVLARVVGDSPVEYLTTPELKAAAFALGKDLLLQPGPPLDCPRRALEARG